MARPVGTFGGYEGRAIRWIPDRHGLLTFAVRGQPSDLTLYWSFGQSGELTLGRLTREGAPGALRRTEVAGWVTLEQEDEGARLLLSRAWPALRVHQRATAVRFETTAARLLGVWSGRPELRGPGRIRETPSEPWLVLFEHGESEDWPMLLTLQRRPRAIDFDARGLAFELEDQTAVQVMPLEGLQRRNPRDPPPVEHWIACARAWVQPLLGFPTACTERCSTIGDRVNIDARFELETLEDEWGNRAELLAPYPPAIALAAAAGYPVTAPPGLVVLDRQRNVPSFYGPLQFVPGDRYTFSIPSASSTERPHVRSRDVWTSPIREELSRVLESIGEPAEDYVDNNLRVVAFFADAWPELCDDQRRRAVAYSQKALEAAVRPLYRAAEPVTGQAWWTLAKTWRSRFSPSDPPWAKDHERFDSEFYNGQALSALAAATRIDPALVSPLLQEARQLDEYNAIFLDWATGSVMTHATGDSANLDGVQFAWEGMLAAAQLASMAGDDAWRTGAAYRAARQQAALYAMWCQPAWVKSCDYAIGHVSKGRLPSAAVETLGPVDAFVKEFGASTLEFRSFWQTTNFLFYANRPLFDFYRRFGLLERIRAIEYEAMPRIHPRWFDGNAVDPAGENGQERYGAAWTAAHLAARAALFDHDPLELFDLYRQTSTTPAAETWYRMQLPQIAGPLLLMLLETSGPSRLVAAAPAPHEDGQPRGG